MNTINTRTRSTRSCRSKQLDLDSGTWIAPTRPAESKSDGDELPNSNSNEFSTSLCIDHLAIFNKKGKQRNCSDSDSNIESSTTYHKIRRRLMPGDIILYFDGAHHGRWSNLKWAIVTSIRTFSVPVDGFDEPETCADISLNTFDRFAYPNNRMAIYRHDEHNKLQDVTDGMFAINDEYLELVSGSLDKGTYATDADRFKDVYLSTEKYLQQKTGDDELILDERISKTARCTVKENKNLTEVMQRIMAQTHAISVVQDQNLDDNDDSDSDNDSINTGDIKQGEGQDLEPTGIQGNPKEPFLPSVMPPSGNLKRVEGQDLEPTGTGIQGNPDEPFLPSIMTASGNLKREEGQDLEPTGIQGNPAPVPAADNFKRVEGQYLKGTVGNIAEGNPDEPILPSAMPALSNLAEEQDIDIEATVGDTSQGNPDGPILRPAEGHVEVEPDNSVKLSQIAQDTLAKFAEGTPFQEDDLIQAVQRFAHSNYFTVRKTGRNAIVCSKADNSNSKKKQSGQVVLKRKSSALACGCGWGIKWSRNKNLLPTVHIISVNPNHNHECNQGSADASFRKSGNAYKEDIALLTQVLGPLIVSKRPIPCNVIRWTIKPFLVPGIHLNSKTIGNIMRTVKGEIDQGKFTIPKRISHDGLRAFTSEDITSDNCAVILKDLITNSDADTTWIVTKLMFRLAEQDEYFDFRIHYDKNDDCDLVTWQTGFSRGSFTLYHSHLFLDARKSENMNSINMRYLSIVGVDANNQLYPASESFVFEELSELYGYACGFTIEMTPSVSADMINFGVGDAFLSPGMVKEWFPSIVFWIDPYHFCCPTNKHNVLLKDFGPLVWNKVQTHMIAAVYAETENDCLSHLQKAIEVVGDNQSAKNKIAHHQERRRSWSLFVRNEHPGHLNIKVSTYAEQNHSSIKAIAGDDATRSIEDNITDVIQRTGLLFQGRQVLKDRWATEAAAELERIKDPVKRQHLTAPRKELDRKPYSWFKEEYELYKQYNIKQGLTENNISGSRVRHTSNSNDGYFIPDDDPMTGEMGICPCTKSIAMMNICCHMQAKRIAEGKEPYCRDLVSQRHYFRPRLLRIKAQTIEGVSTQLVMDKGEESNINVKTPSLKLKPGVNSFSSPNSNSIFRNATVFSSPSNIARANSQLIASPLDNYGTTRPKNLGFKPLMKAGTELVNAASARGNEIQHAVFSMLKEMKTVIESGDYDPEKLAGRPIEGFATQLQYLTLSKSSQKVPGMPKTKDGQINGPPRKHRLGGPNSSVSQIPKRACTFCGGSGGGIYHTNRTNCPIMQGLGTCLNVNKVGATEIAKDLSRLALGDMSLLDETCRLTMLSRTDFSDHLYIEDVIPSGTKRLQVKAYMNDFDVRGNSAHFFMCSCINAGGETVTQSQGLNLISYDNVFLECTMVGLHLNNLDYVFYNPIKIKNVNKRKTHGSSSNTGYDGSGIEKDMPATKRSRNKD